MKNIWKDLSVSNKLFSIVSLMILVIAFELFASFHLFGLHISIKSLIVGEGIWTKAQKDAVYSLNQYANSSDVAYLENFNEQLKIIDGDRIARVELGKENVDLDVVRKGLIQGNIKPEEIDGIIYVLLNFKNVSFIKQSLHFWSQADLLIEELRMLAQEIQKSIDSPSQKKILLKRVGQLNSELTELEQKFSNVLIEGSRYFEKLIRFVLFLVIICLEGIAIVLVYRFSRYLAGSLSEIKATAVLVGQGNFDVKIPVKNSDELGLLSEAFNRTIENLNNATLIQKKTEESLRRSNDRFSLMVDAVKDYAIFSLDQNGFVLSWNSGAEHITGYNTREVIGEHFSKFYSQCVFDKELHVQELQMAIKNGRFEREILGKRKDGKPFWAYVTLNTTYNELREVTSITEIMKDITDRKNSEIQLKQNNLDLEKRIEYRTAELQWRESQLIQVTDALPAAVCQIAIDKIVSKKIIKKIVFANESFCKLVGRNKFEILDVELIDVIGHDFYTQLKKSITTVLSGLPTSLDLNLQKDGMDIKQNISLVPDFDKSKQVTGFVLVSHDIKKYKEIEYELKKAKELAEIANETKSSFLANMSHEIRTPLGAVLGFSEIILNNEISESQKKNIAGALKRNGQLLSAVINDILDLSKVEAGKLEIEKVQVNFDVIIKDIEALLDLKATEKGIRLNLHADNDIPLSFETDPVRLRQILLNIIGNAIKFTRVGEVNVHVKLEGHALDKTKKLAFVVQDTGIGMTLKQSEKIFAPFSQADISTTRKFGGSGLGLILSKKLAIELGGDVVLNSSVLNQGSTFTVTIDTGLAVQGEIKSYKTENSAQTTEIEQFNFSHLKILLVEDSLDNQFIITHFLKNTGVDLRTVNNGQECVDVALKEHFDLILLDLQMPIMGGFEAIKILNEKHYKGPIVALTAHAMKEDRKQCLKAGFKDHLSKPVNRQSLLKAIHYWTTLPPSKPIEAVL